MNAISEVEGRIQGLTGFPNGEAGICHSHILIPKRGGEPAVGCNKAVGCDKTVHSRQAAITGISLVRNFLDACAKGETDDNMGYKSSQNVILWLMLGNSGSMLT